MNRQKLKKIFDFIFLYEIFVCEGRRKEGKDRERGERRSFRRLIIRENLCSEQRYRFALFIVTSSDICQSIISVSFSSLMFINKSGI